MIAEEKAGQLTQYFCFRLPAGADPGVDLGAQPRMVEKAIGAGCLRSRPRSRRGRAT